MLKPGTLLIGKRVRPRGQRDFVGVVGVIVKTFSVDVNSRARRVARYQIKWLTGPDDGLSLPVHLLDEASIRYFFDCLE